MGPRLGCVLYLILVACGAESTIPEAPLPEDPTSPRVPYRSGDRLTAVVADGGGGAVILDHFVDTTLGLPCTFALIAKDDWRCLPAAEPALFRDASCQELAVAWPHAAPPPSHAAVTTETNQIYRGVRLGPAIPGTAFRRDGDACVITELGNLYAAELANNDFVAALPVARVLDGGLGVAELHADDGAIDTVQTIEAASGEPCFNTTLAGDPNPPLCLAGAPAYDFDTFRAGGCAGARVGYSVLEEIAGPSRFMTASEDAGQVLLHAGELVLEPVFYASCEAAPVTQRYRRRGDVVTDVERAGLPRLGVPTELGTGPLRVEVETSAGGEVLAIDDVVTWRVEGEPCAPRELASGGRACIGPGVVDVEFADPACTHPIIPALEGTRAALVLDARRRITRAHELGASYAGAVYLDTGDACLEIASTDPHAELGPELDLAGFPPIALRELAR